MWFTIIILIVVISAVVLFKVYQTSERQAAQPLETPTKKDLSEANLSPDLPVADENETP